MLGGAPARFLIQVTARSTDPGRDSQGGSMKRIEQDARNKLLRRRDELERLRRQNERMAGELDALQRTEPDLPDRASEVEAAQVAHRLSESERRELLEIEAALGRIAAGTFGLCESCGGAIGTQRLAALPETRFCIACMSERALHGHGHGGFAA